MNINSTKFKDLKILKLKRFIDLRGNLVKTINKNYKSLKFNCFESYISISKKGAVRGLHGQLGKYSQSKIIYCVQGKFLDIAVDLRINSKTYGKVFKKIINSKNSEALLIPKGFAHGVVVFENGLKPSLWLRSCNKKAVLLCVIAEKRQMFSRVFAFV